MKDTMEQTITQWLASMQETFDKKTTANAAIAKSPECTMALRPASFLAELGVPPNFTQTNAMWEAHIETQIPYVESSATERFETVLDPAARKAAIHIIHHTKLVNGQTFDLENTVFLSFNEDCTKISKIVEFTDPIQVKPYLGAIEGLKQAQSGSKSSST